ncbi:cytochrome c oxidase subunit II [Cohnella sp. CIP 111063]|uniref:cytochrome c oxidase subunit II n=1 Tax=unclassified Cohnella TaxID=2636738 RepID=UPI000B8BC2BB|nr:MULTISPECIES: cytochrome c oxidase subunit II [unclassified Cohnella]OXS53524.1 cytochrome c oxidase subunit II [Cohnella sp. CIP 111063]
MMKRWPVMKRLLPLLTGLVLLLTACGREDLSTLNPQGPVAEKQFELMKLSIGIMALVVVVVFAICIYVLIRFRRKQGDKAIPEQVEGNHKLEVIWTVIPIVLLLILGVPTIQHVFGLAKDYSKDKDAVQVKVTAHQYWWEFEYTDYGITTAQDLIVPTGKKISFELAAADVKHSFWIPSIGGKMDTNPGSTNRMFLEFPKEGVFRGKCAELCGPSHALMDFKAKAVSQESFDRWVAAMKAPAVMPADAELAEKFTSQCLSCHAVGENGGNSAPNLTGIGGRETVGGFLFNDEGGGVEQHLKDWITDPQGIKKGAMMPGAEDTGLTEEEIAGIAKYLAEYKLDY